MSDENKVIVREFIDIWNTGRFDDFPKVMSHDFIRRDIAGKVTTGLKASGGDYGPEPGAEIRMRIEIEDMISEGDKIAVRLHMKNLAGDTTRRTNDVFRVQDGKLAEEWAGHD